MLMMNGRGLMFTWDANNGGNPYAQSLGHVKGRYAEKTAPDLASLTCKTLPLDCQFPQNLQLDACNK
jgi:hypothetical protein